MNTGRGRNAILAILILLLGLMAMVAAFGFYYISLKKKEAQNPPAKPTETSIQPEPARTVAPQGGTPSESIEKIRTALLEKMPRGETERFHRVFLSLELAVKENRLNREEFKKFPSLLKIALADGIISDEELDILLETLEKSIEPPKELR